MIRTASQTTGFADRLAVLRRLPLADRVSALASLLDAVSEAERAPVLVELLEVASTGHGSESARGLFSGVTRRWAERSRRASDRALAHVARRWELVPDELQDAARSVGSSRWAGIASALVTDTDPRTRRSLAKLCADTADPGLAGCLVPLLTDPDPGIAAAADRALLTLAFSAAGLDPESGENCALSAGASDASDRALVEDAVAKAAAEVGEHRRRGPMLAAMALLDPACLWRDRAAPGSALAHWFRSGDAASHAALKAAIRLSPHPLARRRAMEWLAFEPFTLACFERLAWAGTPEEHGAVLGRAHLLSSPARARQAANMDAGNTRARVGAGMTRGGLLPDRAILGALEAGARQNLPRMVAALKPGVEIRRAQMEPFLSDPDALARMNSARCTTAAGQLDLCFDADASVARSAFLSWSLVGERGPGGAFESRLALRDEPSRRRALGLLTRSPHACVRKLAAQEADVAGIHSACSPSGRIAARWMLARDPAALESRLREALKAPDGSQRVQAVQLIRHLGLCSPFEDDLLALIEAAEPAGGSVTATVVAALGELQTPASIAVVHAHLTDRDMRVRANAVEAMARQSRRGGDLATADPAVYGALIELKSDADHRVRANALRALLNRPSGVIESKPSDAERRIYEPAAVGALAEMLGDERPAHRLAAAWLAGRVLPGQGRARLGKRFVELATRVGEVATGDRDPDVRRRALQCAQTLQSELRVVWAARSKKREQVAKGVAA